MRQLAIAVCLFAFATASNALDVTDKAGRTHSYPICGGFPGLECPADHWCDYPNESACGVADFHGTCRPKPDVCPEVFIEVCGCDRKTYGNACKAHLARTDIAHVGRCAPPDKQ